MTALTPEEFYKANIDKEKEYVRIHLAYEVKAGEKEASIYHRIVKEDGYDTDRGFMTEAEFAAQAMPTEEGLELPLPKRDLSEEELQKITAIEKGATYAFYNNEGANPARAFVAHKGFIIPRDNENNFLSDFELTSRFNYTAQNYEMDKVTVFTWHDEQPFKAILLDADTALAFRHGERTINTGSLLLPTPGSEDGYELNCFYPFGSNAINKKMRISAEWTRCVTAHRTTTERQAKLNARAPCVKLRQ